MAGRCRKIKRNIEDAAGVAPCPPHAYFNRDGHEINLDVLPKDFEWEERLLDTPGKSTFLLDLSLRHMGKKRSWWLQGDSEGRSW